MLDKELFVKRQDENCSLTPSELAKARRENNSFRGLSDEAVCLATTKPLVWEYRLYLQVLNDEIAGYESLRQLRASDVMTALPESLCVEELHDWMMDRVSDVSVLLNKFRAAMETKLQLALGEPKQSGDANAIILVSREIGIIYKQFLELAIRFEEISRPQILDRTVIAWVNYIDTVLLKIENYPVEALETILGALAEPRDIAAREIEIVFTIPSDFDAVELEYEKVVRAIYS